VKYWNKIFFLALAFCCVMPGKNHIHHQPMINDQDEVNSGGTTTSFDATSKSLYISIDNISDAFAVSA